MPLLRSLGLRMRDTYVDGDSVPVSPNVCNEYRSQFSPDGPGSGYIYPLPDEDYVCRLDKVGTVLSKTGHISDFSTNNVLDQITNCDYFASDSTGYRIDSVNRDDLLLPGENGNFSIAFWILSYEHAGLVYDIVGKKITGSSVHRFLLSLDGTGSPAIVFSAADETGTMEFSVRCPIGSGRWSLVVARCEGSEKRLSLKIIGEDGFITSSEQLVTNVLGCALPGDALVVGINPDLASNPLAAGVFYLQQVCLWKKVLTSSEEKELFADGRGLSRWSDPSVPTSFGYFNDDPFSGPSFSYRKYGTTEIATRSPAMPCKTCDSEPDCWPGAMPDYSPDSIVLTVAWTAAADGCVPTDTEFVMYRNQRQIIQGFRFGRTFESEEIPLSCGGTLKFFLESTPFHMSKFRYRQYLGVETTFGGLTQIAKFNITLGMALIKSEFFGNTSFTSPDPTGANFAFPFTDSFTDYASQIVAAGWTDFATVLFEEPSVRPGVVAACVLANGYRFTVGTDRPEIRGGDCGWQMGVMEWNANIENSLYNYTLSSGGLVSVNTRVPASDPLLNRPFTAVARGLIGVHNEDGLPIIGNLPFEPSSLTIVMTPEEFVRPEPFTNVLTGYRRRFGAGGCIDCDVTARVNVHNINPSSSTHGVATAKILKTQCTQKTLAGANSVIGMGAAFGETIGVGLLRLFKNTPDRFVEREVIGVSDFGSSYSYRPIHVGGTFTPDGKMQFTGQSTYEPSGGGFVLVDIKPEDKIDPNNPGTYLAPVQGATTVFPFPQTDTPESIETVKLDRGNRSSVTYSNSLGGTEAIVTVDNCTPCPSGKACNIKIDGQITGLSWLVSLFVDSAPGPISCGSPDAIPSTFIASSDNGLISAPTNPQIDGTSDGCEGAFPGQHVHPVSGTSTGGFFTPITFTRDQLPLRAGGLLASSPGMTGNGTFQNPPDDASWGFLTLCGPPFTQGCQGFWAVRCFGSIDFPIACGSVRDNYVSVPCDGFGMVRVEVSVSGMVLTQLDDGRLRATLTYEVMYIEFQDMMINSKSYWHSDNVNGLIDTLVQDVNSIRHIAAALVQVREVIFESSILEDICLRASVFNDTATTLNFVSETVISTAPAATPVPFRPVMTTAELEEIQFDRALGGNGVSANTGIFTQPFDSVVPDLTPGSDYHIVNGYEIVHNTWSPGSFHTASGRFQFAACCGTGGLVHGAADNVTTYSPTVAINPYDLTVPQIVDWSGVTISLSVSPQTEPILPPVQFPSEYTVVSSSAHSLFGTHLLTKETISDLWAEVNSSGSLVMSLDPTPGTIEVFPEDEVLRVVARYRIAGFPDSRWNRNGDNQMQLVSADWSIGDWPIYLTVSPVIP